MKKIYCILFFVYFFFPKSTIGQTYSFVKEINGYTQNPPVTTFSNPWGIAVDATGNIYVADRDNNRIQKFNSSGVFLMKWGTPGAADGQFNAPIAVATDVSGNVYVADYGNHRIQKFNSSGGYLSQWGSYGTSTVQFIFPIGIAIDGSGNIFVSEEGNHRIQKFDASGRYLTQWGTLGTSSSQFTNPTGIVLDGSGNILVADRGNNRIQKFNSIGGYLNTFTSQFSSPLEIAIDPQGFVYVSDNGNNLIKKFNSSGTLISQWGVQGTSTAQFSGPIGLAIDGSGNIIVGDNGNNRIQKYSSSGIFQSQWGNNTNGVLASPSSVAYDAKGNIYVADAGNSRIQKFDKNGNYLYQWGAYGNGNGQFIGLNGVIVDKNGFILTAESRRIQKFDTSGTFITLFDHVVNSVSGLAFSGINDIATDNIGKIYIAEVGSNSILISDNSGNNFSQISTTYTPVSVSVDNIGNVYALTSQQYIKSTYTFICGCYSYSCGFFKTCRSCYTCEGYIYGNNYYLSKFTSTGSILGVCTVAGASKINIDNYNNVYLSQVNDTILKLDENLNKLTSWGSPGTGNGQFNSPQKPAINSSNQVIIADAGNNRLQVFAPAPTISGFLPNYGFGQSVVTVTGSYISPATQVAINGASISYSQINSNLIIATIPSNYGSGLLTISTPGGVASSSIPYLVNPKPVISNFGPTSGLTGSIISISGQYFNSVSDVSINNNPIPYFTAGIGLIIATIPSNATSGLITLTTQWGSTTSSGVFTVTAQTLQTLTLSTTSYCQGGIISVSATSAGTFLNGNVFSVQLSNPSGSFLTFTGIGSFTANGAFTGNLICNLPNVLPTSSTYRIRVLASKPNVVAYDNGQNLTIQTNCISQPSLSNGTFCGFNSNSGILSYNSNLTLNNGNIVKVLISDKYGDFTNASVIGSITTSSISGIITYTIPSGLPYGNQYAIKYFTSNPQSVGIASNPFTINSVCITSTIPGSTFCAGNSVRINLSVKGIVGSGNFYSFKLYKNQVFHSLLGNLTSSGNGALNFSLPLLSTISGSGWSISVTSSSPISTEYFSDNSFSIVNGNCISAPIVTNGNVFCGTGTISGNSIFNSALQPFSGNTVSVQLSDGTGSFINATTVGMLNTLSTSGTVSYTLPSGLPYGNQYSFRFVTTNPQSISNSSNPFTINSICISPTVVGSSFCPNSPISINFKVSGTPSPNNIYTAKLYKNGASYSVLGYSTTTGNGIQTIKVSIPNGITGTGWNIAISSSNPVSTDFVSTNTFNVNKDCINQISLSTSTGCLGDRVVISFSSNITFSGQNMFTAIFSNNGFSTFVPIGTVQGTGAGLTTISGIIPNTITSPGSYLIRVYASDFNTSSNYTNLNVPSSCFRYSAIGFEKKIYYDFNYGTINSNSIYNSQFRQVDYDGDGDLDVFTGRSFLRNKGNSDFDVLLAKYSKNNFDTVSSFSNYFKNEILDINDYNQDQNFEVYIYDDGLEQILQLVRTQKATNFLVTPRTFRGYRYINFIDFDKDGYKDFILGNSERIIIVKGVPSNLQSSIILYWYDYEGDAKSNGGTRDLRIGDFNGDGEFDIFTGTIVMYRIPNEPNFNINSNPITYSGISGWLKNSIVSDIDNDGLSDVVGNTSGITNIAHSASFGKQLTSYNHDEVAVGDLNNDGLNDLVFMDYVNGTNGLLRYQLSGNSTIWSVQDTIKLEPCSGWGQRCKTMKMVADIDGDGRTDILLRDSLNRLVLYKSLTLTKNLNPTLDSMFSIQLKGNELKIAWGKGKDQETPVNNLRYNINVYRYDDTNNQVSLFSSNIYDTIPRYIDDVLGNNATNRLITLNPYQDFRKIRIVVRAIDVSNKISSLIHDTIVDPLILKKFNLSTSRNGTQSEIKPIDLNNDGFLDVYGSLYNTASGLNSCCPNGTFENLQTNKNQTFRFLNYLNGDAADFNNDGKADLSLADVNSNSILIGINQSTQAGDSLSFAFSTIAGLVKVASNEFIMQKPYFLDYDQDGDLDIFVTDQNSLSNNLSNTSLNDDNHYSLINKHGSIFKNKINNRIIYSGDLNFDGYKDIIVWKNDSLNHSGTEIWLYKNGDYIYLQDLYVFGIELLIYNKSLIVNQIDMDADGVDEILINDIKFSKTLIFKLSDKKLYELSAIFQTNDLPFDFNNDGLPDFFNERSRKIEINKSSFVFDDYDGSTYLNDSVRSTLFFPQNIGLFDFDNDSLTDIIIEDYLYYRYKLKNTLTNYKNFPPEIPQNLQNIVYKNTCAFTWNKPNDINNPNTALHYNVEIWDSTGRYLTPRHSLPNGKLTVLDKYSATTNKYAIRNIPDGKYHWRVQAIDVGFSASPFSSEGVFEIKITPNITGTSEICQYGTSSFTVRPAGHLYKWIVKGGKVLSDSLTGETIKIKWDSVGTFPLIIKNTEFNLYDTINVYVKSNPAPVIRYSYPIHRNKVVVKLKANSPQKIATYEWQTQGNSFTDSLPTVNYKLFGEYSVGINVNYTNGCVNTNQTKLSLFGPVISGDTIVCTEEISTFNVSPSNYSYDWLLINGAGQPSNNTSFTAKWGKNPLLATLIVTNKQLLTKDSLTVRISKTPTASFVSPSSINTGELILFSDSSTGNIHTYAWDFGEPNNMSGIKNPQVIFNYSGLHNIKLSVSTSDNCSDVTSKTIIINSNISELKVANLLTPNADGKNDKIYIENIERYPENQVTIYNAWGGKIKEFSNYSNDFDLTNEKNLFPDGNYLCVVELVKFNKKFEKIITIKR